MVEPHSTPSTIGRYHIQGPLNRGGMSAVYRAYDPLFERPVAIKVLPAEYANDPTWRSRFTREAKAVATLEHPAIVPVYDFGEHEGHLYLVMRLMLGGSLAGKLEAQIPLPLNQAGQIIMRLVSALEKAHAKGLVHRDIKPANILFDEDGEAYLADFGIVRLADQMGTLTGSNVTIGTPGYMSPEQIQGQETDKRADIYALGVVAFEIFTGRRPFEADVASMVLVKQMTTNPPSAHQLNPELPPAVDQVLYHSLAINPDKRIASATQFGTLLQQAWHPDLPPYATPKPSPIPSLPAEVSSTVVQDVHPTVSYSVAETVQEPTPIPTAAVKPKARWPWAAGGAVLCFVLVWLWWQLALPPFSASPPSANESLVQAQTALDEGDYRTAVTLAQAVLQDDPDNVLAYNLKGQALSQLGLYPEAQTSFDEAIALDPAASLAYLNRANLYLALGEFNPAVADANYCLTLEPVELLCYEARAVAYKNLGMWATAEADYTTLIANQPEEPRWFEERGHLRLLQKNVKGAREDLVQALVLNPEKVILNHTIGTIDRDLGQITSARTNFMTYKNSGDSSCTPCMLEAERYLASIGNARNLSFGLPISSNFTSPGYPPEALQDGNPTTAWSATQRTSHFVELNLQTPAVVETVYVLGNPPQEPHEKSYLRLWLKFAGDEAAQQSGLYLMVQEVALKGGVPDPTFIEFKGENWANVVAVRLEFVQVAMSVNEMAVIGYR